MIVNCFERNDKKALLLQFNNCVQPSFSNALRRSLLLDVPSLAVEKVNVFKNTTTFPCETIAQRLTLVPLNKHVHEGDKFEIEADGPCHLYSDAITINACKGGFAKGVLVARLAKGQQLKMTGSFKKSTGSEHARFQKTAAVSSFKEKGKQASLSFESIDDRSAAEHLLIAVDALIEKLEKLSVVASTS